MKMPKTEFIFIGGCQRTGTTFMQAALCSDPTASPMLNEAYNLARLVESFHYGRVTMDKKTADYFRNEAELCHLYQNIGDLYASHLKAHLNNPQKIILKDPIFTRVAIEVLEMFPHAHFICMMRDPRAVIASLIQVSERYQSQGQSFLPGRSILDCTQYFHSFYHRNLKLKNDRIHFIRFEDLILNPNGICQYMKQKLGLQIDTKGFNQGFDTGTFRYAPQWDAPEIHEGAQKNPLKKYLNILTQPDIELIEKQLQHYFQLFSYPLQKQMNT
jgi:hypothetical protein